MQTTYDSKIKLYFWGGLVWDQNSDINGNLDPFPLCPKQKCHCKLVKSKEKYSLGEYKYGCIKCDFKITLNKSIEDLGKDVMNIVESLIYKDAEIINIDGDLFRVQREEKIDNDYWVDVKLSKNKKDEMQLMVLAGSKKTKDKTQLFLDVKNGRMSFDQNNDHPSQIFAKVEATFKETNSKIISRENP